MTGAPAEPLGVLPRRSLRIERLGLVPYGAALALQQRRHADVLQGQADDTLLLLQHPPVVTLGRNAGAEHLLVSAEDLAARGIELHETGRGGDITYHGPGQVIGYPIVHLCHGERDVRRYVWRLEEILLRAIADLGVKAARVEGLRGIWAGDRKLAAIGVRIARWTTMHGFALNVRLDLPGFDLIVPCGLHGRGVTSLQELLGEAPPIVLVQECLAAHAAEVLGREAVAVTPNRPRQPRASGSLRRGLSA